MKTINSTIILSAVLIVALLLSACGEDKPGITKPTPTPSAPSAPSHLSVSLPSSSSLILEWQDNSSNEDGFNIERSMSASGPFQSVYTVGANTSGQMVTTSIAGLSSGTTYYFRVRAHNGNGNSGYSNVANGTTSNGGGGGVPTAPSGLSASATGENSISISWTDNANNESGFKIERSLSSTTGFTQVSTAGANATSRSMTGLSAGTRYYFRVRAYNATGNSNYSNTANATTHTPQPKPAPILAGPSGSVTDGQHFQLSWTYDWTPCTFCPSTNGYRLEESSTSAASGFSTIYDSFNQGERQSPKQLVITPRAAGTYWYRVRAHDGGWTDYSNVVRVTVTAVPAAATRFVNNTSYALVSLRINGQEQFPVSPMGLLPGQSLELEFSPGTYTVTAANGFWDGSARFTMYTWSGNFSQQPGQTGEVRFNDPTIEQLLTQFTSSRLWEASYWSGTTPHVAGWRFYSNGTANFYIDGVSQGSTTYSLVQRNPGAFNVVFRAGGFEGTLWETFGWFGMWNGPGGSALQYWPVSGKAGSPAEGPVKVPLNVSITESVR